MVRRTFLSNIFSVQSDCPHREKFGYGGDIAATSEAFIDNFDMAGFYAKAVRDWGDAARPDGMLTETAPFVGIQYCGVGWAMAHSLLLEQLYRYYGDRRLLEEQYATSAAWIDLVSAQNPEGIIKEGLSDHEGLEEAPAPQMATPLYFQSARLMSRLAAVLGKAGDAARYERLADSIRTAYLRRFLTPGTGMFSPTTQAGQAFALYLGLVPPGEKDAVLSVLLKKVKEDGRGHLSTGIFGTKFMLDVLSGSGHADAAYGIVDRRTFPGWGYMLENGATTLWEHWEGSDDTFSHNHPMFGSVSDWFFKWLAGIQPCPDAVGFDRIAIRPQPAAGLTWVKAFYDSMRGRISSEWKTEGGRFVLTVTIPANTTAEVHVPASDPSAVIEGGRPAESVPGVLYKGIERGAAVYSVGSGTYIFSSEFRETGSMNGEGFAEKEIK
jgi:alpha-L-rhamnosidase